MPNAAPQTIVNAGSDDTVSKLYPATTQSIPVITGNASIFITNKQEYITNYVNNTVNSNVAGGNSTEVQFNINDHLIGDSGLTYNADTDSLTVTGVLRAGSLKTDSLLYANGASWDFGTGGSSYGNSNVASYLGVYTGSFAGTAAAANSVAGGNVSGAVGLATYATTANSVAGGNVSGAVGSATTAGTVTTAAQPNITSTGTLSSLTVSGTTNLGAVGNITISGGTTNQVLKTDGAGHLSWTTVSGSSFNGGTITNALNISNVTDSISYITGALTVGGGAGIAGNIHVHGHITSYSTVYAGRYADLGSWITPVFIGRDAGASFIQGALVNTTETGSADWVAYGDNSDDTQGWADFGYTGTQFSDTAYTITKPGDGYFIVQGLTDSPLDGPLGGNLIIATGEQGSSHDIIFGLGGFLETNEFARMSEADKTFEIQGEVIIKNHNGHGGAGFAGMLTLENDTATHGKKFVRIDSTGTLEVVNDLYTNTLLSLTDSGDLTVFGNIHYNPSTPSNWAGTAPTTIGDALDRLAAVVKALNSGTGA
jgi:hypothetical protein